MLPAVGEVLLFTLSFVLGIAVPATIVRRDIARLERRAVDEQLSRAWPDASVWSAVVVFGPISVPIHFLRTRRSWLGVLLALAWFVLALVLIAAPVEVLAQIFGISE
jgi:hypothetical protein